MEVDLDLRDRITTVRGIFGGKPVIRGRRLAVEHVLEMLAAGDDKETVLREYEWLEPEDIHACILFGQRMERGRDWERDREWTQDVEAGMEGATFMEVSMHNEQDDQQDEEWEGDVEPDYDWEEDSHCRGGWLSSPA